MSDSTMTLQPAHDPDSPRGSWEQALVGFLAEQDALRLQAERADRRQAVIHRLTMSRGVLRRRRLV